MQRRKYLLSCVAAAAVAGCMGGDDEDDTSPGNESTDDTDTSPSPADGGTGDDSDNDGNGDEDTSPEPGPEDPTGVVPDSAIHQWAMGERSDDAVVDGIGGADGDASPGLENVSGEWLDGYAEFAGEGEDGYIDLGYLDSINASVDERSITVMATVAPDIEEPGHPMTILGAGGGESDWFEFRIGESDGSRSGQPMLFVQDHLGNTIRAAGLSVIEPGTAHRVVVRLDGTSGHDVTFWVDGEEVPTEVVDDDGLSGYLSPDQSYGIFASNPQAPGTIGTRRWFTGTIDNVVICDDAISAEDIASDYEQ